MNKEFTLAGDFGLFRQCNKKFFALVIDFITEKPGLR
jgi:hypothetical protein